MYTTRNQPRRISCYTGIRSDPGVLTLQIPLIPIASDRIFSLVIKNTRIAYSHWYDALVFLSYDVENYKEIN